MAGKLHQAMARGLGALPFRGAVAGTGLGAATAGGIASEALVRPAWCLPIIALSWTQAVAVFLIYGRIPGPRRHLSPHS